MNQKTPATVRALRRLVPILLVASAVSARGIKPVALEWSLQALYIALAYFYLWMIEEHDNT